MAAVKCSADSLRRGGGRSVRYGKTFSRRSLRLRRECLGNGDRIAAGIIFPQCDPYYAFRRFYRVWRLR